MATTNSIPTSVSKSAELTKPFQLEIYYKEHGVDSMGNAIQRVERTGYDHVDTLAVNVHMLSSIDKDNIEKLVISFH